MNKFKDYINLSSINKTVRFMQNSGLEFCFLFGGSTTINDTKPGHEISDYDISVSSLEEYKKAVIKLHKNNWNVKQKGTNALSKNASVVFPPKGDENQDEYDFQFNKTIENKSIFNLESFYIAIKKVDNDYGYKFIDPHDGMKDFEKGKLRILPNREHEDDYNVLKRFLVLSGKYSLPMGKDGVNKDVLKQMKDRFSVKKENTPDHLEAKGACLDKFFKTVQRVKNPNKFLFDIAKADIMKDAFPEMDKVLKSGVFHKFVRDNKDFSTADLLNAFYDNSKNQDEVLNELKSMKHRTKAKVPEDVMSFLDRKDKKKVHLLPMHLNRGRELG